MGPHVPKVLRVDQTGMIEVFSCGSTYPKGNKCIPKWLGVLWWDDIYPKVVGAHLSHKRVACGSTHVPKVVRVDLAGRSEVLHVGSYIPKVVGCRHVWVHMSQGC